MEDLKMLVFMIVALARKLKLSPKEFTKLFMVSTKEVNEYLTGIANGPD